MTDMSSRMNCCLLVLLVSPGLLGSASAQQRVSLTVERALELGLQNNKVLHASRMKVEAADAKASETNASRLPALKFGGSYTRLSKVDSFFIGPFPPILTSRMPVSPSIFDSYNLKLSLQQPLYTGNRISSSAEIAEYTAQATQEDYGKDKADLIYNVRNAYWTVFKAREVKKVLDESVEQMKSHLKDVQNMESQGIVTRNEVLKIEVQLSNASFMQIDAANNVTLAAMSLNNLIGLPLGTVIDCTSEVDQGTREHEDLGVLIRKALEQRPEIRGMDYRVKASESGVALAKSGWLPQVFFNGNYYYARPNSRIFPAVDQFRDTWDLGITLSFDLWNWGTTLYQTTQAQAQLVQAQDALSQLRDGVNLEVTQNYLTENESKERIAVAEKAVSQAEENYRITSEKFKSGLALNTDLLDAEVALLQAKWNRVQALVDYELAGARLKKAIGELSPPENGQ